MNLKSYDVEHAYLHSTIFIPGGPGQLGPTLSTGPEGKTKDLKMRVEDGFFILDCKGKTVVLPMTSVAFLVPTKGT